MITWDRRVRPQATAILNWWVIAKCLAFADRNHNTAVGSSDGFHTTIPMVFHQGAAGVNRCGFYGTPEDIIAFNGGLATAAFTNFPIILH